MGKLLLKVSVLLLLCTVLYPTVGCDKINSIQDQVVKFVTESGKVIQETIKTIPETIKPETEKPYKQNIAKVIKFDHELSTKMNLSEVRSSNLSDNEKLDEIARRISNYVQSAKKALNFDELPSDFVSAYISHLNAWKQKAQEIANHPDMGFWSNVFEGFLRGLCGDFTGGAFEKEAIQNEWVSRLNQHEEDINSTWNDVEAVAAKYGVNVNNCE